MGCAASQPVVEDLTSGQDKLEAVKHAASGSHKQMRKQNHSTGGSANCYGEDGRSKDALQDTSVSTESSTPQSSADGSANSSREFCISSAGSCDDSPQQQRASNAQHDKQQSSKHPQPVRPLQLGVHDSAGSAEARGHRKSKAPAQAATAAAPALSGVQDALSPLQSSPKQSAAAAGGVQAGHTSFQGSCSSDAASSSQDDQFVELGACSGQAMSRLSAAFNRRLSRTDERGSADLDRRQSLNYMKQVDCIVQSFDIRDDEIEFERDEEGNDLVLGHGAYGQVYKGLRGGVQDVAVKVIFDADEAALSRFIKEISLLKSLNYDRNIVQFYGARLRTGATPMMVLEYMEGGNLRSAIDRDYTGQLKWNMRGFSLALDIAKGIHFLHAHNVIHSDLKTSNILLDRSQTTAKISDVGLARVMERKQYRSSDEHAWTFVYAAPEMLMGRACTEKSDIYSFGVCLWELVMREAPVRGRTHRPKTPQDCPEIIAELIKKCMNKDPNARPTAREVHDAIKQAHSAPLQASSWFA